MLATDALVSQPRLHHAHLLAEAQDLHKQFAQLIEVAAAELAVAVRLLRSSCGCGPAAGWPSAPGRPGPRGRPARSCGRRRCPRSRRKAATASSSADRTPSPRGDPCSGQGSGPVRGPDHPPDGARNTPGDHRRASHWGMAPAGLSAPAASDGRTRACACPILLARSIAVTGIWADSGASVERLHAIYARQAPGGQQSFEVQLSCKFQPDHLMSMGTTRRGRSSAPVASILTTCPSFAGSTSCWAT